MNKLIRWTSVMLTAIALIGTAASSVSASASDGLPRRDGAQRTAPITPTHDPDHVLVRFRPDTPDGRRREIHAGIGGTVASRFEAIHLDVVRVPKGMSVSEVVALYDKIPEVTYANLNRYVIAFDDEYPRRQAEQSSSTTEACNPLGPNDPKFCDQWALHNDGSIDVYTKWGMPETFKDPKPEFDIDALDGWELLKPASEREPVTVAILETGIDHSHEDLQGANIVACARAIQGYGEVEPEDTKTVRPEYCTDYMGYSGSDGTAVAGLIAAQRDNGKGIAGLAPDVRLAIGQTFNELEMATMADYLAMIEWATNIDADVIVFHKYTVTTLNPGASPESAFCNPDLPDTVPSELLPKPDPAEKAAWQAAYDAGALIVAGGGMTSSWTFPTMCVGPPNGTVYPAGYDFVTGVGATNPRGQVWNDDVFVHAGQRCNDSIDIMGPGEWVWSATADPSQEHYPYSFWAGGLPATAYVAGVAALVMSQEGLNNEQVEKRLIDTATEVESHPYRPGECAGIGQVNLAAALAAGPPTQVDIDVKPGSEDNPINSGSNGSVPVAILSSGDFDASTVDPLSVTFGPGKARSYSSGLEDVDGDGDLDLVLHFDQQATGLRPGDTEACLEGSTTAGETIRGCDSVTVK